MYVSTSAPPKTIPREELAICIPLLYAALEDRGAEVRRGAGEAVLGFMMHLGPESMARQAEKLKVFKLFLILNYVCIFILII